MDDQNVLHLWRQNNPTPVGETKTLLSMYDLGDGGTYLLPATTGNKVHICTVPGRVQAGGNWAVYVGDHDTGANLVFTLQLWDGTTAYPLIHQTTVGQAAGGGLPSKGPGIQTGIGKVPSGKNWELQLLIDTGAGGGARAAKFLIMSHFNGFYPSGIISE